MFKTSSKKSRGSSAQISRRYWMLAAAVLAVDVPTNAMTIVPSYQSSVTSLSNASTIETAVGYAIQQIDSLFSDSITININVEANTSGLGESNTTTFTGISYSTLRSDLITSESTATDTSAYATLPMTNPLGSGNFAVATSESKAIGLQSFSGVDGTFTFNSSESYAFSPSDRAVSGEFDFIGIAEHEITEIMGRVSQLGTSSSSPYDLFRYTAPGTAQPERDRHRRLIFQPMAAPPN